jgi:hypothetical protein
MTVPFCPEKYRAMSVFPDRAGPVKIAQRFAQPAALERPAKAEALHSVIIRLEDAPLRNSSNGKAIWRIGAAKCA